MKLTFLELSVLLPLPLFRKIVGFGFFTITVNKNPLLLLTLG